MTDSPFERAEAAAPVHANFNVGDLLNRPPAVVHPEIARAQTGLSSQDSSLPGMISKEYSNLLHERPVAAVGVAGLTTAAAAGLLWKMPAMSSHMAGAYGATKLVLTDAPDLLSGAGAKDYAKYGLACAADMAMVAGLAARYVPQVRRASMILTASGIGARVAADFLPDTARPQQKNDFLSNPVPLSEKYSVAVSTKTAGSENRPYNAYIPEVKDKALPVVLMLPGVQNDSAPGMEAETGLNRLAKERGFIAVYPFAKDKEQAMLGKVQDWNSPGAGLTTPDKSYDDVDYVRGVIDQIKTKAKVDENAIYVVGFSSGGEFAQHLRGRMPGVFAGVGSIHGTLLGSEAKPQDKAAFVSVHSDGDHMLPYTGGRGIMTSLLPRVADSQPKSQVETALQANGLAGAAPRVSHFNEIRVSEYGNKNNPPVKEFLIEGGLRGGFLGGLVGRGRDAVPATHAVDGPGAGGWPIVGDKNRGLDTTRLVVDELLKHKRNLQ